MLHSCAQFLILKSARCKDCEKVGCTTATNAYRNEGDSDRRQAQDGPSRLLECQLIRPPPTQTATLCTLPTTEYTYINKTTLLWSRLQRALLLLLSQRYLHVQTKSANHPTLPHSSSPPLIVSITLFDSAQRAHPPTLYTTYQHIDLLAP